MKKSALLCVAIAACMVAAAQKIVPLGAVQGNVPDARTTLYIDITVERQEITAGPYARYAQKYLGVSAPLSDKVTYGIKSANIDETRRAEPQKRFATVIPESHMRPVSGFPKLAVDRLSNTPASLEESARLAAQKIFDIRRNRYDLISGEAGENVFGAGLKQALTELDRLEDEYLSLFLGKQKNTTATKEFRITPVAGKQTYIICRFSAADGLLSDEDMSGQPVVLETKPLGTVSSEGLPVVSKPNKYTATYRIADDASCRVIFNNGEIYSTVLPVLQFGQTIYLTVGN